MRRSKPTSRSRSLHFAIAHHLQNVAGLSMKKVIQALRPIQQITVLIAGHEHVAEDPTTPVAEAILDTLGFSSVTPPGGTS